MSDSERSGRDEQGEHPEVDRAYDEARGGQVPEDQESYGGPDPEDDRSGDGDDEDQGV